MAPRVLTISTQEGLQAVSHPLRVSILGALDPPGSAASLVVAIKSHQKGNFIETLYEAAELLDSAAFDSETISSAAVAATVNFADEAARAAFIRDYLKLTRQLIDSHAGTGGDNYCVELAVHPITEQP
ncbi:MAG: hypothetical protein GXP35_15185 [Actinobacteria bacterium]|nr:hypothetical protein [Actinomycetota bacterium]